MSIWMRQSEPGSAGLAVRFRSVRYARALGQPLNDAEVELLSLIAVGKGGEDRPGKLDGRRVAGDLAQPRGGERIERRAADRARQHLG